MLETERLLLKLIDEEDAKDIVKWRNQIEVINNLFSYRGITLSEHKNWFERYLKDNSRIEFVILVRENNKKIGTIGLSNIDYKNQKAEYGILIGEKAEWGKGYAEEASFTIINYGFKELNLKKIYLHVFKANTKALKLYNKLGFVEEGILRRHIFKNGDFKDVVVMSILRDEWEIRND